MPGDTAQYGIVTYHDGFNFGAYLQVYALQRTLDALGMNAEIINYKHPYHWFFEYRCLLQTRRRTILTANLRKMVAFFKAQKKLRQSHFSFRVNGFSDKRYGCVIFGSDEIWNYANPIVKLAPFYFGVGVPTEKRISYAASCGSLPSDSVVPDVVSQGWRCFDHISVRDGSSQSLVRKYVDRPIELVVDPTLLMDFSGEEGACPQTDFILVYTTGFSPEVQRAVRDYASKVGKRLISIGYHNDFCDQNVIGIGPFEFLGYFRAASLIITSMFHGTIFAVKYHKCMAIIVDPYRTNKLATMLDRLGIRERVTDAGGLAGTLGRPIDYEQVDHLLSQEVEHSMRYLRFACAES